MKNVWIILAASTLLAAGCGDKLTTDDFEAADGNAGFIASEIASMGLAALDAVDNEPVTGTMPKTAGTTDTLRDADVVWTETTGTWIRTANARYANAVRTRTDTLKFYDAAGNLLQRGAINRSTVDSMYHARTTDITGHGGNTYQAALAICTKLYKTATETTAVKNGLIRGEYNGFALNSVDVTDVTFPRQAGEWMYPRSGTVDIERPLRSIVVTFTGNGTATAAVTNKPRDKTYSILLDVESGDETE